MVQEIDNKKQLTSIINDPESLTFSDIPLLRELVNRYPYFQPLRLILARLSMETEDAENTLTTTALYTNGAVLHQFLQPKAAHVVASNNFGVEEIAVDASDDEQPEEIDCVEEVIDTELPETESANKPADIATAAVEPLIPATITSSIVPESTFDIDETKVSTVEVIPTDTSSDEQETFEEITEVDAHDFILEPIQQSQILPVIETLEDNFVENIAATDFFAFEENFNTEDRVDHPPLVENIPDEKPEEEETNTSAPAVAQSFQLDKSRFTHNTNEVTNYDDDTLPYTFLWWLAKTRKEHSNTFQPYASPKKQNPNELQQQYVEHIFHIQSPFNAEEILNTEIQPLADPKDAKIIDAFIQKDPQISAPRPEQIDNENKAKKSAEDHNDLVSETLAKIYIEQMLYHKAIDTYEKLSLKFPEKSRYFADLIQSIKKKI